MASPWWRRTRESAPSSTTTEKAPTDENLTDLLQQRPHKISLTVKRRNTRQPWGCQLHYDEAHSCVRLHGHIAPHSVLDVSNPRSVHFVDDNASLLSLALQPDDVLERINEYSCEDKCVVDIQAHLEDLTGVVTIVVSTTTMMEKTIASDPNDPITVCQAIRVRYPDEEEEEEDEDKRRKQNQEQEILDDLQFTSQQGRLQLQCSLLSKRQHFGSHVLGPCDWVLAIDATPSLLLTPQEATELWHTLTASATTTTTCSSVTVQKASASQRRWSQVRRAAVAASGGTLVGVGAVIMATPLHPVGHAMAIGGVGVLATEFDTPRKVLHKTSQFFRSNKTSAREEENEEGNNDEEEKTTDMKDADPDQGHPRH